MSTERLLPSPTRRETPGGKAAALFRRKLKGRVSPYPFHWSGYNSDTHRHVAAAKLLDELYKRETAKRPYHIVGHSHGGNVIYAALWLAVEREKKYGSTWKLDHLCSWTTVAAPFFDYRFDLGRFLRVSVPVLQLVMMVILVCAGIVFAIASTAALRSANLLAAATAGITGLLAGGYCLLWRPMSACRRVAAYQAQAMTRYGDRWVGISSKHDEAFELLRHSLAFDRSFVPKWDDGPLWRYTDDGVSKIPGWVNPAAATQRANPLPRHGWHQNTRAWLLTHGLHWPLSMVHSGVRVFYNWLAAPWLDRQFSQIAALRILGSDLLYFRAAGVSRQPKGVPATQLVVLTDQVEANLVEVANKGAAGLGPKLRAFVLGQIALLPKRDAQFLLKEYDIDATVALVHCGYFENEDVWALILLSIERRMRP